MSVGYLKSQLKTFANFHNVHIVILFGLNSILNNFLKSIKSHLQISYKIYIDISQYCFALNLKVLIYYETINEMQK